MGLTRVLLLSAAATSAIAGAERSMRMDPDVTEDEMPSFESESESEEASGLMALLNEHFQRSSDFMSNFWRSEEADEAVHIVVIEEVDPAFEKKMACLQGMKMIDEQKKQQQTESLMKYFHSAVDALSMKYFGETSCEDLHRYDLEEQCAFVLNSKDAVQKLMLEGMTNEEVCDLMTTAFEADGSTTYSCELCEKFVQMVEVAVIQSVQQVQQVYDIIEDVCDNMSVDSMCHTFLKNFDAIVDWVEHGTEPLVVCSRISMCPADRSSDSEFLDYPEASEEPSSMVEETALMVARFLEHEQSCSFCSHVAEVMFQVNRIFPLRVQMFKSLLGNLCEAASPASNCQYMEANFDVLMDLLHDGYYPGKACKALDVCRTAEDWEMVPLIVDGLKGVVKASLWSPGNTTECTYCQFATTVAKIALQQYGADIRQVRAYADMICDMLGEDNPCHIYVKEFDYVIDSITKGMSSKAICVGLKFCADVIADKDAMTLDSPPAASVTEFLTHGQELQQTLTQSQRASTDNCFFCMDVTSAFQKAITANPDNIAKICQTTEDVCESQPSGDPCHSFVKNLSSVVDDLLIGDSPEAICFGLEYCSMDSELSTTTKLEASDMTSTDDFENTGNMCAYCNGVVTVTQRALEQTPEKVAEMHKFASMACLERSADDECHNDIKMFSNVVANLQSGEEPEEICQTLNYCSPLGLHSKLISGLFELTGGDFLPTRCATCQQNTLLLASLVTRPDSLATFENQVFSLCRLIPESSECELLMNHQDEIIDSLMNHEDVGTICTRVGECALTAEQVDEEEKSMPVSCLFCEFTADLLERAKDNENDLYEAKITLETVCTIMPPRARCDVLSSKFDELLSLVRQGESPSEACHSIALCDAEFVFSPTPDMKEDAIEQAFEKAHQSMGNVMEIQ